MKRKFDWEEYWRFVGWILVINISAYIFSQGEPWTIGKLIFCILSAMIIIPLLFFPLFFKKIGKED